MKKILIFVFLVFLNFSKTYAQDIFDPPKLDTVAKGEWINKTPKFILGWNWGSPGKKIDDSLNINT